MYVNKIAFDILNLVRDDTRTLNSDPNGYLACQKSVRLMTSYIVYEAEDG